MQCHWMLHFVLQAKGQQKQPDHLSWTGADVIVARAACMIAARVLDIALQQHDPFIV